MPTALLIMAVLVIAVVQYRRKWLDAFEFIYELQCEITRLRLALQKEENEKSYRGI